MPRVHKVWKRKQDGWYYVTLNKKKVRLSLDKGEAEKAMYTLLAQQDEETDTGTKVFPTFRKVADLFLKESEQTKKPNTFRMIRYFLQSFCDFVKKKRVQDLKVHHVSTWVNSKQKRVVWNDSSKCSARSTILGCLNWGVQQGHIQSHPLGKLKRGSHKKRERVLTKEERQAIRDNVKPEFREFLFALEQTGARPFSELALLAADMIDWKAKTVTFKQHKNEGKGKRRTIYLSPAMFEMLTMLAERHPTGLLFRNIKGHVWTSHDATRRLHYVLEKLKMPRATVYAFRHTFITEALERGMTANVVAELVGNSPLTIARNYDHLNQKTATMLDAAAKAVA